MGRVLAKLANLASARTLANMNVLRAIHTLYPIYVPSLTTFLLAFFPCSLLPTAAARGAPRHDQRRVGGGGLRSRAIH